MILAEKERACHMSIQICKDRPHLHLSLNRIRMEVLKSHLRSLRSSRYLRNLPIGAIERFTQGKPEYHLREGRKIDKLHIVLYSF